MEGPLGVENKLKETPQTPLESCIYFLNPCAAPTPYLLSVPALERFVSQCAHQVSYAER